MKEFETLREKLLKMGYVLTEVTESFAVFEALRELSAPNIVGKSEANKNVVEMNRHLGFFGSTQDAHRVRSMLKLSHMFDKHPDALSLPKLLNVAEGQNGLFTKEAFSKANAGRPFLEEMKKEYVGIKQKTITRLRGLIESKREVVDRLLSERDQYLAHTDWKAVKQKITSGDMQELIKVAETAINDLLRELNNAIFDCQALARRSKKDTKSVLDRLRKK
jgi:hypothetical protein